MFNFPTSPIIDQVYPDPAVAGVPQYFWNGTAWIVTSSLPAAPLDALAYSGMQINGSMEVAQERGYDISASGSGAYGCDGWSVAYSGTMVLAIGDWPSAIPGFPRKLGLGVTTAQVSMGAGDYAFIQQAIEGYRISRLGWGTASAKPITIAFWAQHHRTGTYTGVICNSAADRNYAFSYTQSVADAEEYKVITVPGCTSGTWTTTNTTGLLLIFAMACGTTYTAPSLNTWLSGGSGYLAGPGQINGVAATSDAMNITGVIILPGIYAPTTAQSPLIMRPYDQELVTCQRYYAKQVDILIRGNVASGAAYEWLPTHVPMRAVPTTSMTNIVYSNASAASLTMPSIDGAEASYTSTSALSYIAFNAIFNARL